MNSNEVNYPDSVAHPFYDFVNLHQLSAFCDRANVYRVSVQPKG